MTRLRTERGSAAIELVILTPVLVAAILTIAAGARYVDARGQTNSAAFAAARAASLTTSQDAAVAAGESAAEQSMAERGLACANLEVGIDAHEFVPGGSIRATVTCTTDLSDLVGLGLPGTKTFTATATVPLEAHRELR
jgi:Flp pilus assembly protein TadG